MTYHTAAKPEEDIHSTSDKVEFSKKKLMHLSAFHLAVGVYQKSILELGLAPPSEFIEFKSTTEAHNFVKTATLADIIHVWESYFHFFKIAKSYLRHGFYKESSKAVFYAQFCREAIEEFEKRFTHAPFVEPFFQRNLPMVF